MEQYNQAMRCDSLCDYKINDELRQWTLNEWQILNYNMVFYISGMGSQLL